MSRSLQPTMKDVAREAGVALGTVSRVFNGFPVGEEYRERVEAAAEKLNYRVNNYARGLKTNKTFCVGLLMPSLRHPFFAALIDELTASLMRRGYLTNVMITNFDPDAELKCFRLIEQNKVDGIIALTYRPDLVVEADVPVVTIDRQFHPDIPCVSSDNSAAADFSSCASAPRFRAKRTGAAPALKRPAAAPGRNMSFSASMMKRPKLRSTAS